MATATATKKAKTAKEALKLAVIAMNDGGKHWIKHALHAKKDDGSMAHCSIGGINHVTKPGPVRELALIALADAIDPKRMVKIREGIETARDFEYVWNYHLYTNDKIDLGLLYKTPAARRKALAAEAEIIIIEYNDAEHTRWARIKKKFEKAVDKVEA
jgi:hypothetical protein